MEKDARNNQNAAHFMKLRDNLHEAMAQVRKAREKQDQSEQAAAKETARR